MDTPLEEQIPPPPDHSRFRSLSCVLLGGIAGFFIGTPAAAAVGSDLAIPVLGFFSLAGFLIGYRKRKSPLFFYVALIAVMALGYLVGIML